MADNNQENIDFQIEVSKSLKKPYKIVATPKEATVIKITIICFSPKKKVIKPNTKKKRKSLLSLLQYD